MTYSNIKPVQIIKFNETLNKYEPYFVESKDVLSVPFEKLNVLINENKDKLSLLKIHNQAMINMFGITNLKRTPINLGVCGLSYKLTRKGV